MDTTVPKNIVVCDDDLKELNFITEGLATCAEKKHRSIKLIPFFDAQECLEYALVNHPDAIFFDIYIGKDNGCDIAHRLRQYDQRLPLVFITDSPDFALEAFNLSARHYLLKPISLEQLEEALDRLELWPKVQEAMVELQPSLLFPQSAIMYCEVTDRKLAVHLSNGKLIVVKTPLSDLEKRLDKKLFLRCHRSFLVNMDFIESTTATEFVLKNGEKLPIRLNGAKETKDAFFDYLFSTVRK